MGQGPRSAFQGDSSGGLSRPRRILVLGFPQPPSEPAGQLPADQPSIWIPGDLTETVRCFERAARILVPWPRELFSWPDELARARSKVRLIDPVLTLPPVNSLPFPARKKVYAVV